MSSGEANFRHALKREHNLAPLPKPKRGQRKFRPPHAAGEFGGILNATNIKRGWRMRKPRRK